MNRPTRPQIRRELGYLRLRVRAALASARSAITVHRKKLILLGGGALFLLVLGIALIKFTGNGDSQSPVVASSTPAITTARIPAPTTPAPTPTPSAGPPNPPAQQRKTHRVATGQTLATVALNHGVPYELIADANGLSTPYLIHAGQWLLIPASQPGVVVVAPGTTLTHYSHTFELTVDQLRKLNPHITHPDRIMAGSGLRIR